MSLIDLALVAWANRHKADREASRLRSQAEIKALHRGYAMRQAHSLLARADHAERVMKDLGKAKRLREQAASIARQYQ